MSENFFENAALNISHAFLATLRHADKPCHQNTGLGDERETAAVWKHPLTAAFFFFSTMCYL